MDNPYNQNKNETEYNHWEAGFHAASDEECPYEPDDTEYKGLRKVWMKGYNASNREEKPKVIPKAAQDLESVSTDVLEALLMKRKKQELEQLKQQRVVLDKKITRLSVLCGTDD